MLPKVPGIIEGSMTITPEPDGRMSFRVLIGAEGKRIADCDLIELIISPEHINHALASAKVRGLASADAADQPSTFPCHIGFCRSAVHKVA